MTSLKTILVATDFSDSSQRALDCARAFADAFGSSLHLLNVVSEPLSEPWQWFSPGAAFLDRVEKLEKDARDRMREMVRANERAARPAVLAAVWGEPAEQILKYAQEHAVDLIVCGTHGRRGLDRLAMGSVAEQIVRSASCPVLTTREAEPEGARDAA
jgi:nucleotide-binding universal stress UspA family protein